jgi:hypothetical protein
MAGLRQTRENAFRKPIGPPRRVLINFQFGSKTGLSLARTEYGSFRAGRGAFRTIGRAARADQRDQELVIGTAHVNRAGDDPGRWRWAGVPLRAGWAGWAGRSRGALRSSFAALAGGAYRPLCTGLTLRTLRTDRTLGARRANFATLTGGALGANGSLRALGALRSGRTDGTWGAGRAERARWALWPGRRFAASRDRQYCEDGDKRADGGAAKPFATHAQRMHIA